MYTYFRSKIAFASLLLLLAALWETGCRKDFLDRKPLGGYTSDDYPYPEGGSALDQYIFAAYGSFRSWGCVGEGYVAAANIRSDDAVKGSVPTDALIVLPFDQFPVPPDNGLVNTIWEGYYDAVTKCNIALSATSSDSIPLSADIKTRSRAEARFLRGYAYFTLVRFFGRIPLVDTVVSVGESSVPQSSVAEVYQFIEQDLQFAAAHLPDHWDARYIGRATSGAAHGLLAKVYLYEEKWQQAMAEAGTVIQSGLYNLETPYDQIFTEAGENGSGSLFEIQCYSDANHPSDYGSQYAQVQGVRGTGTANLGWGLNVPTEDLVAAYESDDPRQKSTILFCPSREPTRYGESFPSEPNPRYNMKVYTDPAKRQSVNAQAGYWVNIRVLRYADVLLMYAEAANELGQTDEALQKLEMVRARARGTNDQILPEVTTRNQQALRERIRHERRVELAMEDQRFFDLVRWKIAGPVMHDAGVSGFNANRDGLLPIPQVQIDLSQGANKLQQNPGY